MSDCLFCGIIAGTIPADIVYENDAVVAFRDINPQAPTHVLVIPRTHTVDLVDAAADPARLGHVFAACKDVAAAVGLSDFRTVVNNGAGAGQTVFHLHVHLLGGRPLSWPPG